MSISIQNILLATDFSESAVEAQRYALALTIPLGAKLHVLHIVKDPYPLPSATGVKAAPVVDPLPKIISAAEKKLTEQIAADRERYPEILPAVKVGDPVSQILDYANTHAIDLIILGTHGRSGLSHLIIGSVAEKVVRMAKCPVLTAHSAGQEFFVNEMANGK